MIKVAYDVILGVTAVLSHKGARSMHVKCSCFTDSYQVPTVYQALGYLEVRSNAVVAAGYYCQE